jgi:hypothetical protein
MVNIITSINEWDGKEVNTKWLVHQSFSSGSTSTFIFETGFYTRHSAFDQISFLGLGFQMSLIYDPW